jgi:CRP-like cAMP-binding protein
MDKITTKMSGILGQMFADSPDLFEHRIYQKEEILFTEGSIIDNIYFVTKGILRTCRLENNIDVTSGFYFPQDIIIPFYCMRSFHSYHRKPAILTLQAVEESEAYSISFEKLEELQGAYQGLNESIEDFALQSMRAYLIRSNCLAVYSKEELYNRALEENPYMIRVPDRYISTYIGTDRSYLNRLRNRHNLP